MGHDWVFDVLKDLRAYALTNDLPALAQKVEEALRTAELEIGTPATKDGKRPKPKGLPH
ncbi:hypothetical protein M3484_16825 [Pseudomonas sp. GX19020]|uniref:hypothetical protein n=1 Tax=Pseudomonas sp. GX19020 TaxID=2942277 RepID=UPI0020199782|nr:hypothetical protein [Pseudomonas sp. GX19020]MCL4068235.1 hypothetical protein [Pseudomonas sp. GX19020]